MANLLAQVSELWADINPGLKQWKVELDGLRDCGEFSDGEIAQHTYDRLVMMTRALSRMEKIVADIGLVRSRVKIAVDEAQNAYDDRWREVMQSTRIGEYTSAQERNATYTASSVQQLLALRRAQRMYADIQELYDYAMFRYRGLDNERRFTDSLLRNQQNYSGAQ
jgi:hypothetical protein